MKKANALNLIIKQIQTQWKRLPHRKNIYDAATYRKLTRLKDIIYRAIACGGQLLTLRCNIKGIAHTQIKMLTDEPAWRGNAVHQCLYRDQQHP